jgi:hypothetical protein
VKNPAVFLGAPAGAVPAVPGSSQKCSDEKNDKKHGEKRFLHGGYQPFDDSQKLIQIFPAL